MSVSQPTEFLRQTVGALVSRLSGSAFARLPRFLLEASMIAIIAFSASSIFLTFITPPHQTVAAQSAVQPLLSKGESYNGMADKLFFSALDGSQSAAAAEINAKIKLFGTRPTANGRGSAIISVNGGAQQSVSHGARLKNGVRVTGVFSDRIEVIANDEAGAVYLFDAKQRRARRLLERVPFDQTLLSALDLQFTDSGVAVGSNGSVALLQTAGLVSGDVIGAINGKPVNTRARLINALSQAQDGTSITLDVARADERLTRRFDVAALRTLLESQ